MFSAKKDTLQQNIQLNDFTDKSNDFSLKDVGILPNLGYKFIIKDNKEEFKKREIDVLNGKELDLIKMRKYFSVVLESFEKRQG